MCVKKNRFLPPARYYTHRRRRRPERGRPSGSTRARAALLKRAHALDVSDPLTNGRAGGRYAVFFPSIFFPFLLRAPSHAQHPKGEKNDSVLFASAFFHCTVTDGLLLLLLYLLYYYTLFFFTRNAVARDTRDVVLLLAPARPFSRAVFFFNT